MVVLLLWVLCPVQLFTKAVGCLEAGDYSTEGAATRSCIERMKSSQWCCIELNPEPPSSLCSASALFAQDSIVVFSPVFAAQHSMIFFSFNSI